MSDPTILALDLATRTGFALGGINDRTLTSGSVAFGKPGAPPGAIFSRCRSWVADFVLTAKPTIVVFEQPLVPMFKVGQTNFSTIRILVGLAAIVEEQLYGSGIQVSEARVSDIRRHFIGTHKHGRAAAKSMTIMACRRLGWSPVDDNAADAMALWHYQASVLNPRLAIETSPLFRRPL